MHSVIVFFVGVVLGALPGIYLGYEFGHAAATKAAQLLAAGKQSVTSIKKAL